MKTVPLTFNNERVAVLYLFYFFILLSPIELIVGQDLLLQKCLAKADIENVVIKCNLDEVIAIKEAFFTSSIVDQCPFAYGTGSSNETSSNDIIDYNGEHNKGSCTDDLRMTLNSKCSGRPNCAVNLRKAHNHQCPGYDGWVNIKYSCITKSKMHSYCNRELSDNYGYISNPGYPKYYPAYNCKWKIKAYPGQRIQIDILDLSLKEPRFTNKKVFSYECSDYVAIIEDNAKAVTLCGEIKSNLIEYRSKTHDLIIDFVSYDFSPTRGVLFKYTLLNCPTLKPPSNGYMYRNGSYAYYTCHFDYVFEDTGLQNRALVCEYDTYWNGSVPRCVPKENVTVKAYALTHQSGSSINAEDNNEPSFINNSHTVFNKGLITPISVGIIVIVVMIMLIVILVGLHRKSVSKTADV